MDTIEKLFYLVLARNKKAAWNKELSGRITVNTPALKSNEIVMQLNISVPKALFERPSLEASIIVPEPSTDCVIDAGVIDIIEASISKEIGVDVKLMVQKEDD